ncbi:synaptic vesicle membrane protein VAT-1 homolog-like isoform X2 [Tribolium castaneum]|uniref:Synaptic vesicle membrane protein VAT-1 homolog-like n=1 Tax=Tribolium castaneum TaxID=7070 RepID=D6WUA2_TRICA|nr:PREDICTED: synaptic vesicle membrane protein VAT-1 homolog-like isoform X2 [Tribolium castaneum]EFA06248.1 Synaptic vesicle membrane protein VAT-1 homolog-like [Tribolium castaneum]|eukprot:XP_971755.1 PREDICTED: synaptic vesicle membrane protein VAT-1 homolog-like isoform X2 [Tribolium castaneum]
MSEQAETAPTTQEEQKTEAPTEEKDVKENGTGEAEPVAEQEKEAPKEMRAVVLNGFGGLKSVKILKKPEPALNEGEVLIRVKACGLNFQDLMVRQGAIDSPPKCPFILGFECAGEIEQVAEGVEGFAVGDQVVALPEFRAWAELVAVPAKYVFKLPKDISHLDAAAITMNYAVAYILLFEVAGLSKGKSILVHSVGGGVGQAVVQLAKTVPDVTIFGICSKGKHEALKSANSPIDHLLERGSDYVSEIRKVSPDGIDIVLDCLCGEECNKGYSLLKPMGKYILYGSSNVVTGETKSFFSAARSWWQVDKISPLKLFDENRTISGFNLRRLLFQQGGHEFVHKAVQEVFALFQQKKIKPLVDSTWALEDVAEAMQKMHDRKNVGKLILDPSLEPKPKPATPAKGKNKEDKKKQSSEEKKDSEEKKEEEKKEEKKEEQLTNGDSAGDSGK